MVEIFAQPPGNGAQIRLMARYVLRDWARIDPRPYRTLQVGLTGFEIGGDRPRVLKLTFRTDSLFVQADNPIDNFSNSQIVCLNFHSIGRFAQRCNLAGAVLFVP